MWGIHPQHRRVVLPMNKNVGPWAAGGSCQPSTIIRGVRVGGLLDQMYKSYPRQTATTSWQEQILLLMQVKTTIRHLTHRSTIGGLEGNSRGIQFYLANPSKQSTLMLPSAVLMSATAGVLERVPTLTFAGPAGGSNKSMTFQFAFNALCVRAREMTTVCHQAKAKATSKARCR